MAENNEKKGIFDRIKDVFDGDDDDKKTAAKPTPKPADDDDKPQGLFGSLAEKAREAQAAAAQKAEEAKPQTWADSIKERAMDAMKERKEEAAEAANNTTSGANNWAEGIKERALEAAREREASKSSTSGAGTAAAGGAFADAVKRATEAAHDATSNAQTQSAPAAPAPAAPAAPEPQRYTVQGGDTLGKIAKRFYGDASQWKRIWEANRDSIANPDVIHVGQEFVIPDANVASQERRTYTVRGGDTLRAIAERFYGDEMQWKRIWEANRDSIANPDVIHVGQEFIIP